MAKSPRKIRFTLSNAMSAALFFVFILDFLFTSDPHNKSKDFLIPDFSGNRVGSAQEQQRDDALHHADCRAP